MADSRRYVPSQQLDLEQILQEAQHRWLRPAEICEILCNYQQFELQPAAPDKPPGGSLFLFDRKAVRYFRKDGHCWRKKKDGNTAKEAHEKLKTGSVNALHCYYAHGEDNENFQRRSYWMLNRDLEHIVLVHYRDVKEGHNSGISRLLADPGSRTESPQTSSAPSFTQANSPASTVQTSYVSNANRIDWSGQALSSEFEDVDSGSGPIASSLVKHTYGSLSHNSSLLGPEVAGFPESSRKPPGSWFAGGKVNWPEIHSLSRNAFFVPGQKTYVEQPSGAHRLTDVRLGADSTVLDIATCGDRLITNVDLRPVTVIPGRVIQLPEEFETHPQFQNPSSQQTVASSASQIEYKSKDGGPNRDESGELKKLDSFVRWMDKEIGGDCDDSLMASDSGNYLNTLDAGNDDKEASSLSHHMQLETDSLGPSLSQEQLFSIRDFSPDWAYTGFETKVLVVGTFLGTKKLSNSTKWGCMFGEIEVSAEVLTDNVIRCQAPSHTPGHVPFYVTCSNRLACSEVREFEYRQNPLEVPFSRAVKCASEEEVRLQMRFAKLLCLGPEKKWFDCSVEECDRCKLKSTICSMRSIGEKEWGRVKDTAAVSEGDHMNSQDQLIQNLLEERLYEWLVCRVHEGGKVPNVLDDEGLGVIHLAASLGYEWGVSPIIAAGVSPNFRDAQGRTGLHWASYFGREGIVISLVRLGAAPGAVDDPTPAFPWGQTAADLASSRGHKGIAGYLAEADLSCHLSSLNVKQNVFDSVAATFAAEKALDNAAQVVVPSDGTLDEQISLKGSLAAVRKSAHAAALIQAAFRARSFRQRQSTKSINDISDVSLDLVALGSLKKVQKLSHFEDYLHSAAIKIQQKYRGWKGRKEFLKIRKRIVQLQAHVRGHQVRKQYQKVVWSVSIMEKVILRWRRKGAGLRGFQVKKATEIGAQEIEEADEYEFLRIGREQKVAGVVKALERVKSMVHHPEARDQYMRLVAKFENFKIGNEGSTAQQQGESSEKNITEEGLDAFLADK